ncbi:pseudouridine synthase [Sphingomonas sp.]|uniref:pseudouridine synthase n=1 Tax=Sphingomonas sp. TaxID=28214 RepID=UPI002ED85BE1
MSPPSSQDAPREGERIAKLLARAGIASRREVERMIAEGRVAIDGATLTTPATVLPSLRGVTVDGNPVAAPAPARLFRFHKPSGLLTTERDPAGRPTIYSKLPRGLPRLMPVGRLDLATEGLLLMTTDGELKRQLELPATGVERSYRARAYGEVSQAQLEDLMLGIEIEGVRYGSIDANLERRTGANVWIELTLTEGKNREVRRVLEHLGLKVSRLIRTRYGPFHLGDMPAGAIDEVRQHDLILFRNALAGPGGGKVASNLQLSSKVKAVKAETPAETAPMPDTAPNRAERRRAVATNPPRNGEGDRAAKPRGGGGPRQAKRSGGGAAPEKPRPTGLEKFGVGQRRRQRTAAESKREADPRSVTAPKPAKPKPARPRVDDDAGPLLDRPKRRYRSGDRRPRPPGKRGPRK